MVKYLNLPFIFNCFFFCFVFFCINFHRFPVFPGHAGGVGASTDELEHQQARAEEQSTSCAGCA